MFKGIKSLYRYLLYILAVAMQLVVQYIPRGMALGIGSFGGGLCFRILKKERKKTLRHLGMVFDNEKENYAVAENVFKNLGMNLVEWLRMPRLNKKKINAIVKAESVDKIDRALAKNKGVIIITSHLGNWEYISAYFALNGYTGAVVGRRIYYPRYNKLLVRLRKSVGVETLWRDSSARGMLRVLKNNGLLGILPDQDTDKVEGIFINFLGHPAYTPTGPVNLALATGASIVPCFIVRAKRNYRLYVEDPLDLVTLDSKEETVKINTERWSAIAEKYIRKYPEQWVWMHGRWKTKNEI